VSDHLNKNLSAGPKGRARRFFTLTDNRCRRGGVSGSRLASPHSAVAAHIQGSDRCRKFTVNQAENNGKCGRALKSAFAIRSESTNQPFIIWTFILVRAPFHPV
jgi:hypothetical protein